MTIASLTHGAADLAVVAVPAACVDEVVDVPGLKGVVNRLTVAPAASGRDVKRDVTRPSSVAS